MKFEIKNRWDLKVIFECNVDSMKLAIELAISKKIDLFNADLSGADLSGANLSYANLSGANLSGANLSGANLSGANLFNANLSGANLFGANLFNADLSGADLSYANLSYANLSDANLSYANLSDANLSDANLSGADLSGVNLSEIKNMPTFQIVPEIGPFYAFKKLANDVIATLYIPRSARRVNSTGRKCRVEKVKVVSLSEGTEALDKYSGKLLYKVGIWVKPDRFDDDIRNECTNGIHCFITKKEAEEY